MPVLSDYLTAMQNCRLSFCSLLDWELENCITFDNDHAHCNKNGTLEHWLTNRRQHVLYYRIMLFSFIVFGSGKISLYSIIVVEG